MGPFLPLSCYASFLIYFIPRSKTGHAIAFDPWGDVVGRLEDPKATGLAVFDIDLQKAQSVREVPPRRLIPVEDMLTY